MMQLLCRIGSHMGLRYSPRSRLEVWGMLLMCMTSMTLLFIRWIHASWPLRNPNRLDVVHARHGLLYHCSCLPTSLHIYALSISQGPSRFTDVNITASATWYFVDCSFPRFSGSPALDSCQRLSEAVSRLEHGLPTEFSASSFNFLIDSFDVGDMEELQLWFTAGFVLWWITGAGRFPNGTSYQWFRIPIGFKHFR